MVSLPLNSHYIHIEGNLFNQSVVIQCSQFYFPQDLFTLTCQADGIWSGTLPQCFKGNIYTPTNLMRLLYYM